MGSWASAGLTEDYKWTDYSSGVSLIISNAFVYALSFFNFTVPLSSESSSKILLPLNLLKPTIGTCGVSARWRYSSPASILDSSLDIVSLWNVSYSCLAVAENEPNYYPSLTDLFSIWNSGVSFDVVEVILRATMAWVNKLLFKDGPVPVLDS